MNDHLRRTVTPGQASGESAYRTAIDLAVGAGLTWLTGEVVEALGDGSPVFSSKMVSAVLWAAWTTVVATVKRKLWPTLTDRSGKGRTDLPADPLTPLP